MNRGRITRERLLEVAVRAAGSVGLEGLTIGALAHSAEMSKSGVFAHFGSKEELQLAVLASARQRFIQDVLEPSYEAPVGSPRLHALFEQWMDWAEGKSVPGGCPILAAALEFSGRPGVVRDRVAHVQGELTTAVEKTVKMAVEEGHFRLDVDVVQIAYQMHCLALGFQLRHHLLRRSDARACTRAAFDHLVGFASKS